MMRVEKRNTIGPIIAFALLIILFTFYMLYRKSAMEKFENNPNLGNLYEESIHQTIKKIDNEYRSNHIVTDSGREYYFGLESSPRWRNPSTPLSKWIQAGDTLIKEANEKVFYVHTLDGQVLGVHFGISN
jgi:hypothetical protein